MNELIEYKFNKIYWLADLIDNAVKHDEQFWNFDHKYFINAATRFSKQTLLHQYIITTALNHHRRDLRKNPEFLTKKVLRTGILCLTVT